MKVHNQYILIAIIRIRFLYFNEELGGTSEDPKYKYNNTFEEYYSLIGENYYALENFIPCFEKCRYARF